MTGGGPGTGGQRRVGKLIRLAGRAEQLGRHGDRGGHQQRLGDRGVPDLLGVGAGPAPDQVASGKLGQGAEAVGESGQLQPRSQESRCLGALTRGREEKHLSTLHCRTSPYE